MAWRAALIIAAIVAVTVLSLAAAGLPPTVKLPQFSRHRHPLDYDVWIGFEHQVGPATTQPVRRPSTGHGVAGAFVGRGWRNASRADGLCTLTAFDGVTIPLWLLGLALALPPALAWYRRKRRSVPRGFDVLTVQAEAASRSRESTSGGIGPSRARSGS